MKFHIILTVVLLVINSAYSMQGISGTRQNYIKKEMICGDNSKQDASNINHSKSTISNFYQETLDYYNPEGKNYNIDTKTVGSNIFKQSIQQQLNSNTNNNILNLNEFKQEQTCKIEPDGNTVQDHTYSLCYYNYNLLNTILNEIQLLNKRIDKLEQISSDNRDHTIRDVNIPMSQLINARYKDNSKTINDIKEKVEEIYYNLPMDENYFEVYNKEKHYKMHGGNSKYNKHKGTGDFNIAKEV
ncbi:MAG: hypothetical protein IJU54_00085 [Alphaproteobacteria bacterium]|nr:hypothetical protein [Alphaproteobacteria bacterium]